MTETQSPSKSLALAIVNGALELSTNEVGGLLHEKLLASPAVKDALARGNLAIDAMKQRELLCRLAVFLARDVLRIWTGTYPDDPGPALAVESAEAWARCPCQAHAQLASEASRKANHQSLAVWRRPPKEAAWAGRVAAWAADAPKYGWQSVAAIFGACRASDPNHIISLAERFFALEASGEEPLKPSAFACIPAASRVS